MTKRVTKAQAEGVLRAVRRTFKGWFDRPEDGPQLMMDFDWSGYGPTPSIVWEGGPYDWPHLFSAGGRGDLGERYPYPPKIPKGVFIEPATGFALSLYRDE